MSWDDLVPWVAAVVVLVALSNVAELWWAARRTLPDPGPRGHVGWDRVRVAEVAPGDVVRSAALSPNPELVTAVEHPEPDAVLLVFASGRRRRTRFSTVVRRHRPAA